MASAAQQQTMTKEEENRLKFRAAISKVLEGGVGEHGGNGESGGVGGCDGGLAAEFKKCLLLAERLSLLQRSRERKGRFMEPVDTYKRSRRVNSI